jgi:hypothetical protein
VILFSSHSRWIMRALKSMLPPGAAPMMNATGRAGCQGAPAAAATDETIREATPNAIAETMLRTFISPRERIPLSCRERFLDAIDVLTQTDRRVLLEGRT